MKRHPSLEAPNPAATATHSGDQNPSTAQAPDRPTGPVGQGLAAARANLMPGTVLWAVALTTILSYYGIEAVRSALDALAAFKQRHDLIFGILSTSVFGGLLPWLVARFQPAVRSGATLAGLAFLMGFWASKGLEINLMYQGLAAWLGDSTSPWVVLAKVALDQFVYVTLWAMPSMVVAYLWRECGFDFRRTVRRVNRQLLIDRGLPVLLANWGVWVPTVALIYCMPLALQLPTQNLVLCLWSLMLLVLTREEA